MASESYTMLDNRRYEQLVAAETYLLVLLQCRYKPVEQVQAVLHTVADAVDAQKGGRDNA